MLTRKQQVFVDEYLATWNASEAARRAGYSARTAPSIGQENLKKPEVAAEIARRVAETQIQPAEVLIRLTEQARGDVGAFFVVRERWTDAPLASDNILEERLEQAGEQDGEQQVRRYLVRRTVLDVTKLTDPRCSRLVRKWTDSPRNGMQVELHDSQAALEKLGKALGVLRENVSVSGPVTLKVVYDEGIRGASAAAASEAE